MSKKKEHKYPCAAWLGERSCAECRQIADERSYWSKEEWDEYWKKQGIE